MIERPSLEQMDVIAVLDSQSSRRFKREILARHAVVRELFDNGWVHLFALEGGRIAARCRPGLVWAPATDLSQAA